MKKIILALMFVFVLIGTLSAATLSWDYEPDAYDRTDGYTVYFTDGEQDYNKTFYQDEVEVDDAENRVLYRDVEDKLNLHPGVEYTFELTRFNDTQESGRSNSATWTREAHDPPTDHLPDPVSSGPSGVNGLGVD